MSRDPQNDLRYIKTEALIRKTFQDMLREMDYAQISIKELTDRAMINRKTFYLHYNTLDELLGKLQAELYMELLESISDFRIPDDLEKILWEMLTFGNKTDSINEKILCSQGNFPVGKNPRDDARKLLLHSFYSDDTFLNRSELEQNILNAYLDGSISFIYSQWVADGRRLPLEKLVRFTADLISSGIMGLSEMK